MLVNFSTSLDRFSICEIMVCNMVCVCVKVRAEMKLVLSRDN